MTKQSRKNAKELKKHICRLTYNINKIKKNLNSSVEANKIYNSLLIERACARQQLQDKESKSKSIIKFLKNKVQFNKKNKLISDYF